jgi:hypothetical protein
MPRFSSFLVAALAALVIVGFTDLAFSAGRFGGGGGGVRATSRSSVGGGNRGGGDFNRGGDQNRSFNNTDANSRNLNNTNVNNRNVNNTNVNNRNINNTNVNDVNVNRDVNVNVNGGYYGGYGGCCYHPVACAGVSNAAVAVTAAAIGSMVHTIPPSCVSVIVNGLAYEQCGSTWYQPQLSGTSTVYVVVNPPR